MGRVISKFCPCFEKPQEEEKVSDEKSMANPNFLSMKQTKDQTPDLEAYRQLPTPVQPPSQFKSSMNSIHPENSLKGFGENAQWDEGGHPQEWPQQNKESRKDDSYSDDSFFREAQQGELVKQEKIRRWISSGIIAAGAFGRILLGMNQDTGQQIAIKQVDLSFAADDARIQALEREIVLLSRLSHKNIVRYFGMERTESQLNILLEYVGGGSVARLVAQFGPLSEGVIRSYLRQIVEGLEYLHQNRVIHRDIKGANMLVDKTGVCKLADFGSGKQLKNVLSNQYDTLCGTPNWMAPEVIKQDRCGRKADIWSLGCTMIEMATGDPPWGRFSNPLQALFLIAQQEGPPPLPPKISDQAKDFLLKCLQVSPKNRWSAKKLLTHEFLQLPQTKRPRSRQNSAASSGSQLNSKMLASPSPQKKQPGVSSFKVAPSQSNNDFQESLTNLTPQQQKSKKSHFDYEIGSENQKFKRVNSLEFEPDEKQPTRRQRSGTNYLQAAEEKKESREPSLRVEEVDEEEKSPTPSQMPKITVNLVDKRHENGQKKRKQSLFLKDLDESSRKCSRIVEMSQESSQVATNKQQNEQVNRLSYFFGRTERSPEKEAEVFA